MVDGAADHTYTSHDTIKIMGIINLWVIGSIALAHGGGGGAAPSRNVGMINT